jgi:UDP-2-acetamido-3-amino-2,3-dideoxy-glucuronate N-acetyltransferase
VDDLGELGHRSRRVSGPRQGTQPVSATTRDLALIGAGTWGKNLARCFDALGALHAIVVSSAEEAQTLSGAFGRAAVTTSIADVLADPAVRKVAIATPSVTHFELARAALEAGKDVFVEKPLCLQASHARALTDLAEAAGRTLMVGHLLQYHPCVVELRALVASGVLGSLLTISSNRLNLGKFRTDENALYSFAPHDVSLVLSLLDDQLPESVRCVGTSHLKPGIADSTLTILKFASGALAQLQVSWLNPFKEQRMTVVGTHGMAVFDDGKAWGKKLVLYRDYMSKPAQALGSQARGELVPVPEREPLLDECAHFLRACDERSRPRTDGREGLRVLQVLDMAQLSLERDGERVTTAALGHDDRHYFAHPSAVIDAGATLGAGCKVWHFSHVMAGARIGERTSLGQNVFVAGGVAVGNDVKVQNNVSLYAGVELESDVFVGPSCVFTNVKAPRAEHGRNGNYTKTLVRRGASIGANATVVCGVTLGRYSFVGAGAVVTSNVPDYALVVGNPARQVGWLSRHGERLTAGPDGFMVCPVSGLRYRELSPGLVTCVDLDDEGAQREGSCSSTT